MIIYIPIILLVILFLFWRIIYFFRDPTRTSPGGKTIVSPADGTVIYVKKCERDEIPISIKSKVNVKLSELTEIHRFEDPYYIIGIFMHPTSVHINRAPIKGIITEVKPRKGKNKPMTLTWLRAVLKVKPFEKYAFHITSNERNSILIRSESIFVIVVQIADIYVNKIICWVKKGQPIKQSERIGKIIFGSQVDILFPVQENIKVVVIEGQKVLAGESIIATY